eukprot:5289193-Lingulodinium_polyedra.AAC.1
MAAATPGRAKAVRPRPSHNNIFESTWIGMLLTQTIRSGSNIVRPSPSCKSRPIHVHWHAAAIQCFNGIPRLIHTFTRRCAATSSMTSP